MACSCVCICGNMCFNLEVPEKRHKKTRLSRENKLCCDGNGGLVETGGWPSRETGLCGLRFFVF